MASAEATMHWSTPRLLFTGGMYVFWLLVMLAMALIATDWALKPSTYAVKRVSFEGPFGHVNQSELERAALPYLTGSFLTVDLHAAQARIETLPWVSRAWVSRRWPNTIHVRFNEQNFIARWNDNAWMNDGGVVVTLPNLDGPADVVQLVGPQGSGAHVLAVYRQLNADLTKIDLSIAQLELTQRRMWKLQLHDGIELVIGRDRIDERIRRFAQIYPFLIRTGKHIRRIDLRYANGIAVAWAGGK
jgi:cell division protein FtsQ